MSELVADCPRCGTSKITFNLLSASLAEIRHDWKIFHETFCVCRKCRKSTVFVLSQKSIRDIPDLDSYQLPDLKCAVNDMFVVESYITLKDASINSPPEFLPSSIESTFMEAARCIAIECFNASASMYRLCLDMATMQLLPIVDVDGLNNKIRRSLGLRLEWFESPRLH